MHRQSPQTSPSLTSFRASRQSCASDPYWTSKQRRISTRSLPRTARGGKSAKSLTSSSSVPLRARSCKSPSSTLISCRKSPSSKWAWGGVRRAEKIPLSAKGSPNQQRTRAAASIYKRNLCKSKLRRLSNKKQRRLLESKLRGLMMVDHCRAVIFLMTLPTQRWPPFTQRIQTPRRTLQSAIRRVLSDQIRKTSIINWVWKTPRVKKFCQKNLPDRWVFPKSRGRQWNRAIWHGPIKWGSRSWTTPSNLKKRNRWSSHYQLSL